MKINKKISGLLTATFLDHFSLNLIMPALVFVFFDSASSLFSPDTTQATRTYWYGIVTSLPYFAAMLATPLLSGLSDRFGRKIIIMIAALGALCFAVCAGLSILTGMMAIMLVGKFTGGLCARSEPTALAAMMDLSEPSERVINVGYLQVVISLGAFIGPIVGGYMTHLYFPTLNFSAPFWFAAFIAILAFLAAKFLFKESHAPLKIKPAKGSLTDFWKQLKVSEIKKLALILILFQIAWSAYYQFFPPILKQYFLYGAHQVGWFVGLIALWLTLTTMWGLSWLKKHFVEQRILMLSVISMALGMLLTAIGLLYPAQPLYQSLIWIGGFFIPAGDVAAYCVLVSMMAACVDKENQGKLMGFCFLLVYVVWGLTSLLSGVIGAINILYPLLLSGSALIALLIYCLSWKPKRVV